MSKAGDAFKRFGSKLEKSFDSGTFHTTLGITALSFGLVAGYPALRDDFTGDKGEAAYKTCFVDKKSCSQESYLEAYNYKQSNNSLILGSFSAILLFGIAERQRKLYDPKNNKNDTPSSPKP